MSEDESERKAFLPPGSGLYIVLGLFVLLGIAVLASTLKRGPRSDLESGGGRRAHSPSEFPSLFRDDPLAGLEEGRTFSVPPPPFSQGVFPCSSCHKDLATDPKPRELMMAHDEIQLRHGDNRWCFDCHNPENRDKLRLSNGTLVDFSESYRLCGQCHGTIYRDWKEGIHGKRTGFWDGAKRYLLCAHCHDPHAPRFKPLKPLPPPVRPEYLRGSR